MEEKSAIELFKLNTENFLTEIITNLAANYDRLFAFCFELRKQDSNNNYSEDLLNGCVKPSILVDIIMNNTWDQKKRRMYQTRDIYFRFVYVCEGSYYDVCIPKNQLDIKN